MTAPGSGRRRQALCFAALLTLCVGCDHAAKQLAVSALAGAAPVALLGDAVRLELVRNAGSFLSLGGSLPQAVRDLVFLVLAPLGLALACAHLARSGPPGISSVIALALLAGGGLGNWLDRLIHGGAVTDFVSIGLGPLRTGIFNVADVCIMAGLALLLFTERRPSSRPDAGELRP